MIGPPASATIVGMGILNDAKEVANAVHEIKNIELYGRVLDLNAGIIDLVEENRRLHAEAEELKNKLSLKAKMEFKEPFYYQDGDQVPFCPACWELKNSAIHVLFVFNNEQATRWDCPACKHTYMDKKDRNVRRAQHPNRTSSPWG
jgi:regulator of replication initiation timing